ncbi:MAG: hypothetical protein QXJ06_04460 [Candidatus Aenigmatarchaeota archaeon]
MAILKIVVDRKTMKEISREIIDCDKKPDYAELAKYFYEKMIKEEKLKAEKENYERSVANG